MVSVSASEARPLFQLASIQGYCDAILKSSSELGSKECAKKISEIAGELLEKMRADVIGSTVDGGTDHG